MEYTLSFARGYIAEPYWPQREKVINVTKESGMNRARSEANKASALTAYLQNVGMTLEHYHDLCEQADRPFYTAADVQRMSFDEFQIEGDPDEITIPPHQIYGCLTQAADEARSAIRVVRPNQVRSTFQVYPLRTSKMCADGTWERFAVVTLGTGQKASNQRALRSSKYIKDFSGTLKIEFDPSLADPNRVKDFLVYAGREIGLGASRKLGWGRFTVT